MNEKEVDLNYYNCHGCNNYMNSTITSKKLYEEYQMQRIYEEAMNKGYNYIRKPPTRRRVTVTCSFVNKDGSCPCTNCIIKMMCKDTCNKYHNWIASFL